LGIIALAEEEELVFLTHDNPAARLARYRRDCITVDMLDLADLLIALDGATTTQVDHTFEPFGGKNPFFRPED